MTHFGILTLTATGHLNTMLPLGQELQKRGHKVTLVGVLDAKPKTLAAGLEFKAICESDVPEGAIAEILSKLGKLSGFAALQYTIKIIEQAARRLLEEAPEAIQEAGIEALLLDQAIPEVGSIAEYLNIPFITVCSALVLHRDYNIPPFNTPWIYNPSWWAILRNRAVYSLIGPIAKPMQKTIFEYRTKWNLPLYNNPNEYYSKLAQLSQQPAEFEFPRTTLPQWFHFTGPYHSSTAREPVSFPWEKLTGQPLIYASMGTLQNRLLNVFQNIAEACENLEAQLVITLGGAMTPESLPKLAGSPLVVRYAPQLELLQRAILTITHGGLNTTLESLTQGVPMVAIPIANDQPGVAARLAWSGAGEVVPLDRLSVPRLRMAIEQVLKEDSYKNNALRLQAAIRKAGGASRAADIIEQAISTGKPVLVQTQY